MEYKFDAQVLIERIKKGNFEEVVPELIKEMKNNGDEKVLPVIQQWPTEKSEELFTSKDKNRDTVFLAAVRLGHKNLVSAMKTMVNQEKWNDFLALKYHGKTAVEWAKCRKEICYGKEDKMLELLTAPLESVKQKRQGILLTKYRGR